MCPFRKSLTHIVTEILQQIHFLLQIFRTTRYQIGFSSWNYCGRDAIVVNVFEITIQKMMNLSHYSHAICPERKVPLYYLPLGDMIKVVLSLKFTPTEPSVS